MSKPRTQSDTISIRIPVHLVPTAERLAGEAGLTVAAYLKREVEASLRGEPSIVDLS